MKWAVGTTNRAKIECVRNAVEKCFAAAGGGADGDGGDDSGRDRHVIVPVAVPDTGVAAQPMDAAATRQGARNRAAAALAATPDADYGVGLEGGLEGPAAPDGRWFECGWMCVIERRTGREG